MFSTTSSGPFSYTVSSENSGASQNSWLPPVLCVGFKNRNGNFECLLTRSGDNGISPPPPRGMPWLQASVRTMKMPTVPFRVLYERTVRRCVGMEMAHSSHGTQLRCVWVEPPHPQPQQVSAVRPVMLFLYLSRMDRPAVPAY